MISKQIKYADTKTQISASTVSGDQTSESVRSEITDLPLGDVNFEVNAIAYDSQHKSESSSSNSLSANLPISFWKRKFIETSKEAYSRYTSSTDGHLYTGPVAKSSFFSDVSDSFHRTSKAVEDLRPCDELDNLPTHLEERIIVNHEILGDGENENSSGVRGKYESSEFSIGKMAEFDLNEDINENGDVDFIQPVVGNVSSNSLARVVAKTGVLSGRPVIPLEFEGGLGWTGSSKMSAFRSVAFSKDLDKKMSPANPRQIETQCCFTGIDLNVVAVEDSAADADGIISTGPILQDSHSEVVVKRAERPCIDLNRLYDAGDVFTRLSIPVKLENSPLLDLNLNASTNKTSYPMLSGYQDFLPVRRDYRPDLGPVQLFASHASLQAKTPFFSQQTLPPQNYHSFTVNTPSGSGHLEPVFRGQSTSNLKIEDELSTSGCKTDGGRQFLFLADNSCWFETSSNKRKETEGGLECYQLRYEKGIEKQ